ncbi:hypothetical protein WMY93_018783 [Mugilogobius chulae]|uniref:Homeobox domain-containing protein n=1 Tax=Mugilogobius chulae TaxID=88201 RepID=A0AAW0NP57_9GOBI
MESYVVSCKYAEPQFPPCEEDYSNFSDQGGIITTLRTVVVMEGAISPACTPSASGPLREDQGKEQHPASHFPGFTEQERVAKEDYLQCQAWMTCAKPVQVQRKTGCQVKDKPPIVVYPWMKKVHVAHVNPNHVGPEPKRLRTAYTRQQVLELEKEFHFSRYLTRRRGWRWPTRSACPSARSRFGFRTDACAGRRTTSCPTPRDARRRRQRRRRRAAGEWTERRPPSRSEAGHESREGTRDSTDRTLVTRGPAREAD